MVDKLLNRRYGALYPSTFVTYRKDKDESPSKVWPITKEVTLTPITHAEYHLRHAGTSTLWAVATSAYDKVKWWGFTIGWVGVVGGPDKLTLAFEDRATAEEWHSALQRAINNASSRVVRTVSTASETSTVTDMDIPLAAAPIAVASSDSLAAAGNGGAQAAGTAPSAARRKTRAWASVLHINGISVYVEEQDEEGEGGAVMVSAVVRAPPVDVFKSLVQVRKSESLGIFAGARTVEVIDANTQVIAQTWSGAGAIGR